MQQNIFGERERENEREESQMKLKDCYKDVAHGYF